MSAAKRPCANCGADISHRAPQARYCAKAENPTCAKKVKAKGEAARRREKRADLCGMYGHGVVVGICPRCKDKILEPRKFREVHASPLYKNRKWAGEGGTDAPATKSLSPVTRRWIAANSHSTRPVETHRTPSKGMEPAGQTVVKSNPYGEFGKVATENSEEDIPQEPRPSEKGYMVRQDRSLLPAVIKRSYAVERPNWIYCIPRGVWIGRTIAEAIAEADAAEHDLAERVVELAPTLHPDELDGLVSAFVQPVAA